jgi:predicted Zn finger-like uncharacterized protein
LRVSCERCATEYDFDPTLIAKGGTRVRCTSCGHTFRVVAPEAEAASWVVRTQDGDLYEVASVGELKARIASRELSPDDEIRRGDEAWKSLGEIVELRAHFEAARGSSRAPLSEPPKLAPVETHKPTLLGVGLTPKDPPPVAGRMTLPELAAPSVPPSKATMREGSSVPPALPRASVPPRDERAVRAMADTLLPHEEPLRGSAATLLPDQGPIRGSATTLLPGQLHSYESPAPSTQRSSPPASSPAPAGGASQAWFEAPSPDEPFVYRPSEPYIAPLPPLRMESERPPRRDARAGRRSGPRLGVLLPVLLGIGFGIGYGLRHRLPDPLHRVFASIHHTLFGHDATHPPPDDQPSVPAVPPEIEPQADEPPAPDPAASPIVEVPAEELLDPPEPEAPAEPAAEPAPRLPPVAVEAEEDLSFDALIRRGERSLERGKMSAARKDFERALEQRPGAPEALTGLGYVALDQGSIGAAAEKFRTAAKASYADAYIGLGEAYRKLGRTEDALAAYERYLERWPGGSSASVARAQVSSLRASSSRTAPPRSDDESVE